jgi:hypothetical protein
MKSPKAPKKTAEQVSVERRQQFMLDEEIEETENRLKSVARGKLGKSSLLASGANRRGGASGSAGGGSSFLSSGSAPTSGPSGGGGTTPSIGSSVNHK